MDKNNLNFDDNYPDLLTDSQSTIPAVIAALMHPLADVLAAMAKVLTVDEAHQEQNDTAENKNLQKQIDYLNSEIEKLKKQVNYHNH